VRVRGHACVRVKEGLARAHVLQLYAQPSSSIAVPLLKELVHNAGSAAGGERVTLYMSSMSRSQVSVCVLARTCACVLARACACVRACVCVHRRCCARGAHPRRSAVCAQATAAPTHRDPLRAQPSSWPNPPCMRVAQHGRRGPWQVVGIVLAHGVAQHGRRGPRQVVGIVFGRIDLIAISTFHYEHNTVRAIPTRRACGAVRSAFAA
jgi:hypothetical protein